MVLGCINRTAWGTKLLLTAVCAHPVDWTSSCHLLKAQHCSLSPNGCFNPPSAPHPPPRPTPIPPSHTHPSHPPTHPPPPTRPPFIDSICDITGTEKICIQHLIMFQSAKIQHNMYLVIVNGREHQQANV